MKPRLIPQIVCIAALLIAILAFAPQHGVVAQDAAGTTAGTLAKPSGAVPVPIPAGDVDRAEIPGQLEQVVREGDYPAQLAGSTGNVQPSRFGPQRNDPDEGIPEHAFAPFDEKLNREHPCPPGGCDFVPGSLVIKFDSALQLVARSRNQLTGESTLDSHARQLS